MWIPAQERVGWKAHVSESRADPLLPRHCTVQCFGGLDEVWATQTTLESRAQHAGPSARSWCLWDVRSCSQRALLQAYGGFMVHGTVVCGKSHWQCVL